MSTTRTGRQNLSTLPCSICVFQRSVCRTLCTPVRDMPNRSGETRKLEQLELEATHADAWAVGGSDESDCVCRGGRCPRMWDCPFWVERRRAEAKGSSAHVRKRRTDKNIYIIPIYVYIYPFTWYLEEVGSKPSTADTYFIISTAPREFCTVGKIR